MKSSRILGALGALLLAPAVAWAQPAASQDLKFDSLGAATFAGHATAEQKVITTKADYSAWFNGTPPATPAVDFTKEDVLAVAAGTKPNPGYGIAITRIEYMTIGITGGTAFVHYVESLPKVGMMYPMVVVSPSHAVKVTKKAAKYIFVKDTPAPNPYDKLSYNVQWPFDGTSATIELEPNGNAVVYRSSVLGKFAPLPGTATAAELKAVNDAFAKANVKTLPASVPDDRVFIIAPKSMQLTSTVEGKDYTFSASLDYYKTFSARVTPLAEALQQISDRLQGKTFDKVTLVTDGAFVLKRSDYVVAWDGTVTVLYRIGMGPTRPFTGRATKAELQTIKDAFVNADVKALPTDIKPAQQIPDVGNERLTTTIDGKDYQTVAQSGDYGQWAAQMKPYIDAIRACGQRVLADALPQVISGTVSYTVGGLKVGTFTVAYNDTLWTTIYSLRGKKITITVTGATGVEFIQATVTTTSSLRKSPYYWGATIETLTKGSMVEITAKSGSYYKVNSPSGQQGWVYSSYVNAAN